MARVSLVPGGAGDSKVGLVQIILTITEHSAHMRSRVGWDPFEHNYSVTAAVHNGDQLSVHLPALLFSSSKTELLLYPPTSNWFVLTIFILWQNDICGNIFRAI